MLLKSKIRAAIKMHSPEWRDSRLAKFTASRISELMGIEGFGDRGENYIRTRVSEELTRKPSEKYLTTESAERGLALEPEAIRAFMRRHNIPEQFARTQVLVQDMELVDGVWCDSRFACTPDVIWVKSEKLDETAWDVAVGEVKCFEQKEHMVMCELDTPQQLKKKKPETYWQLLDQMLICDCLEGYAVFYNPDFASGSYHEIHFRKMQKIIEKGKESFPLREDLAFLVKRKTEAIALFNDKRERMFKLS